MQVEHEVPEEGIDTEFDDLTLADVARDIPREKNKEPVDIKPVGYKYTYTYSGLKKDEEKPKAAKATARRSKKSA